MSEQVKDIKISEVLGLLQGVGGAKPMTRKEIAEHYGVSYASMKRGVFDHPKLKNRKTLPSLNFNVIDDTDDAPVKTAVVEETASTTSEAASTTEDYAQTASSVEEDTTDPDFR